MASIDRIKHYIKHPNRIYAFFANRGFFNFMPDDKYLKMAYKLKTGNKLNLENPKTFNEKVQWMKINCRDPFLTQLVDKYGVREYIREKLGEDYIVPMCGGPWKSVDEIDIDALPERFVLKCTHDSGGLCICPNKAEFDFEKAKKIINKSLKREYFWTGREWPYKNVEPRIIAEEFLDDFEPGEEGFGGGLTDYKFHVFNGKSKFFSVGKGLEKHFGKRISFYDMDGNEMPFKRKDYKGFDVKPKFPDNMAELIKTAEKLAADIPAPFVRVDLYSIKNRIYFSEATFFPCGGAIPFDPPEWDGILGDWIDLEK
ncbi:MAG: glycosyl transferase [Clostridia bacterium]|nr:glycosyl transferase [Clostridia bacterium]